MSATTTTTIQATRRRSARPGVWQAAFIIGLIALWALAAALVGNTARVPNPLEIPGDMWSLIQTGELPTNILASLRRVAVGFGLAAVVGVGFSILMATFPRVDAALDAPFELLRPVPALALIPILLMLVGIGDVLSMSVVFYASVFPIILNTVSGLRDVERTYIEAGRVMGARGFALIVEVFLPAALPSIFAGLRIGFQFAWMSIVGAELIGASNGLGFMILYYAKFVATDRVVVGMLVIGLLGLLFDRLLLLAWRKLSPWAVK